jgi:hypothetical protein
MTYTSYLCEPFSVGFVNQLLEPSPTIWQDKILNKLLAYSSLTLKLMFNPLSYGLQ